MVFQDGFPFLVIAESSVIDLNNRLKSDSVSVTVDNFRPNIVVTDSIAFDEVGYLLYRLKTLQHILALQHYKFVDVVDNI